MTAARPVVERSVVERPVADRPVVAVVPAFNEEESVGPTLSRMQGL